MRLLYVSRSFVGHDERFVNAWRNGGWDVESIALRPSELDHAQLPIVLGNLRQRIADFRPDVVQAGPIPDVAWAVTLVWDGPLIATSWGFDLMKDVQVDSQARERAAEVVARADQLIVDNNGPRRVAVELGAQAEAIVQFPWGIDLKQFRPAPRTVHTSRPMKTILTTRRHEEIYGVGVVIDAFLRAAESVSDLQLMLAGSGSLTDDYRDRVAAANRSDRVTFLGEVSSAELPDVYRAADLYISASTVDGSSVSLLEAMACGVPILVSDIEGNAQWVNSDTGFLFPTGGVDDVAHFFEGFGAAQDELSGELTRRAGNALQLVRALADWDATAARFPEIAERAMERRQAS